MSKHTFSVLTSDIERDPSILERIYFDAAARLAFKVSTSTSHGGSVTTVTAVAA